jgi:lauroyl/myristoyl acyltransferase
MASRERPTQPIMAVDDVVTMATLIMLFALAILFPRSWWIRISRICAQAHLFLKPLDISETSKNLNKQGIKISPVALAEDLLAGNYLENIETVGEYLGYSGIGPTTVTGVENITRAWQLGRGVILWHTPFCGAELFEKRTYRANDLPVTHLRSYAHPYSSTRFGTSVLNPIRNRIENRYLSDVVTLLPQGGRASLEKLEAALRENRIVSVTAIGSGSKAIAVPMLGGELCLARGVPMLAKATGALVIPTATRINSGPEYQIEFGPELDVDYTLPTTEFQENLALAYAEFLTPHLKARPGSWRGWLMGHTWRAKPDM